MKITIEIIRGEGSDKGKQFDIPAPEPNNVTIGRSARESDKDGQRYPHIQISSRDVRLSRWHFMIQMRPPNAYICDMGSTNHTYANDFKDGRHLTSVVELKEGDVIKVGRTFLKAHITPEEPAKRPKLPCTKCGKELDGLERKASDEISGQDFLCEECKKRHEWFPKHAKPANVKGRGKPPKAKERTLEIPCHNCGGALGELANSDGRAEELRDVALYLCRKCASQGKGTIGRYLILDELGAGGMGVVHRALCKATGRLVAIKELLPDTSMEDNVLKVFHREISITRELTHPNIVRFYDAFTKKRKPYLVTEYLPGGNAEQLLLKRKAPFGLEETSRIVLQVLEGLSLAHKRGIVHRDVKPQNILFDKKGTAKLSDMGFAKSFELAGQSGITGVGEVGGTLLFMAPEQITDYRFVKPPADVYSVGVCLYYFITGKFPYRFPSGLDLLLKVAGLMKVKNPYHIIIEEDPIPILERKPDLLRGLATSIDRCLRKDPGERFGDAGELSEALKDGSK